MILDWNKVRVFVKPGPTDMRKQINGLSLLVSEDLQMDIFEGSLFLFCNKHKRILKIIYWDRNGFCLWLERLEKDKFPWPASRAEAVEISQEQFGFLLQGIDFWNAHKKLDYNKVS
jgi:transposase